MRKNLQDFKIRCWNLQCQNKSLMLSFQNKMGYKVTAPPLPPSFLGRFHFYQPEKQKAEGAEVSVYGSRRM